MKIWNNEERGKKEARQRWDPLSKEGGRPPSCIPEDSVESLVGFGSESILAGEQLAAGGKNQLFFDTAGWMLSTQEPS